MYEWLTSSIWAWVVLAAVVVLILVMTRRKFRTVKRILGMADSRTTGSDRDQSSAGGD